MRQQAEEQCQVHRKQFPSFKWIWMVIGSLLCSLIYAPAIDGFFYLYKRRHWRTWTIKESFLENRSDAVAEEMRFISLCDLFFIYAIHFRPTGANDAEIGMLRMRPTY
ncbi:hypothetical protein CEXT_161251 [Caerostris extrusa]|uniref:Uncharacterized protein n=1 Tax=Caerostris extrusa TaxID=172846 RepID=A0AAV4TXK0_CAEEX|nr:hypothetical protein CEXT_161251 [Caerostris extrusa]